MQFNAKIHRLFCTGRSCFLLPLLPCLLHVCMFRSFCLSPSRCFFHFVLFPLSVYMYFCTVLLPRFGCRLLLLFLHLSGRIQMEKLQENDTFYLNAMVNVYVFYTIVYMCKLVVFTIFGTATLVLLSFTFLTCVRLPVVYRFFTCRPDFAPIPCVISLALTVIGWKATSGAGKS